MLRGDRNLSVQVMVASAVLWERLFDDVFHVSAFHLALVRGFFVLLAW